MRPISVSVDALLENGVDEDVTYVVVDTFKFSTTVTVALGCGIDKVYCEQTADELDPYRHRDDFLAGGEMTNGIDEPIGNSPTLIRQELPVRKIALTSDNGARRTHELANHGAQNIVLGCLRNAGAVARHLERADEWVLVPADSDGAAQFEDYLAALLISNLVSGMHPTEDVFTRYEQKADAATFFSRGTELTRDDWQICAEAGVSTVVPAWNPDGYFA